MHSHGHCCYRTSALYVPCGNKLARSSSSFVLSMYRGSTIVMGGFSAVGGIVEVDLMIVGDDFTKWKQKPSLVL
jgi:hypothetical protein